mgnify:CR=1 FL=1
MSGRSRLPDAVLDRLRAGGDGPAEGETGPSSGDWSRRDFLKVTGAAGGGLLLAIQLPGSVTAETTGADGAAAFAPNAYLEIHPDGSATVTVAQSEMGQGVRTSLAMLVAEEAELDWERVTVETAPADQETYGQQGTGGSASVRRNWRPMREAGATARAMLVAAAASELGAPAGELEARRSRVVHAASGRELGYGELAGAAAGRSVPEEVELKSPDEWRLIGRGQVGVDVDEIVTGRAEFGSDVRREGMLHAVVARTPAHGGSVRSFDDSDAREVPGVVDVFEIGGVGGGVNVHPGVAVVAESTWAAIQGRDALDVEWEPGPGGGDTTGGYREAMHEAVEGPGSVTLNRLGDPDGVIEEAGEVHSAVYEVPFLSHATMEPQTCVAEVSGDRCEIRSPTQFPNWARQATAEALGIPPENVEVTIPLLGGGYGRRINPDVTVEAALVARRVDGPVQVTWTREDDVRHDFYRPCAVHRVDAVLGGDGSVEAWRQRFSTPAIDATYAPEVDEEAFGLSESTGAADMLYRVPNRSCEYTYLPSELTRGWWRAVSTTHTRFATECFLDELAEAAGRDPLELRLELIGELPVERPEPSEDFPPDPERLKGVLRRAAEEAGWGRELPGGRGMGIACAIDHLSYSAEVIEVTVEDGELTIDRLTCAVDCGPVVNPDHGRAQVEGAAIQGLSAALKERITVEDGAVVQGNFDDYPILRIHEAPRQVDVHFVETDAHPTGLGEPGLPPAAPALANAIYAATGRRLRTLPLEL